MKGNVIICKVMHGAERKNKKRAKSSSSKPFEKAKQYGKKYGNKYGMIYCIEYGNKYGDIHSKNFILNPYEKVQRYAGKKKKEKESIRN